MSKTRLDGYIEYFEYLSKSEGCDVYFNKEECGDIAKLLKLLKRYLKMVDRLNETYIKVMRDKYND